LSKVNNLPKFIVPSQLLNILSIGHEVPISHQDAPGKQHQMAGPDPVNDQLPTHDGGYQPYKAAGKLAGKKALITGGDSGIGRAVAILYAMEGADSTIVYTPEEEPDARKTQELVRAKGGQIHLLQADLRKQQECKSVVEKAVQAMGRINILVLNHGTQTMKESISELSE
jgi:NADPH:quinone reductase-like Zn-dependent oxidoreductase